MPVISIDDVVDAAARIADHAHRTPVLRTRSMPTVVLKAECFQRTGSFKFRGAFNRISRLTAAERDRGVAAFSSGNHAQAVALAAREVGTTAVILMPEDAPANKVAATRGYGAEVVLYDRYAQDRDALGRALADEQGRVLVPPFDDALIMAGQGTVALELVAQAGPLDVLVVPVGGGGLISGCATAVKATHSSTRVIGVEPAAGDDVKQSLALGRRVVIPVPRTIADGQQTTSPGELTFAVIEELVDEIVVVTDAQIVAAMTFMFERMKTVVEPSGACALAAVLAGAIEMPMGEGSVGVVLSGGNIGARRFASLVSPRED
ncbi:MAG TPA: pyridoxal-phosphate dependent enzyme [Acidimicrobiales bacterium]|nr:pyridoxal-phosphate dependent enzyme [Acidimicrobiales bacterium]